MWSNSYNLQNVTIHSSWPILAQFETEQDRLACKINFLFFTISSVLSLGLVCYFLLMQMIVLIKFLFERLTLMKYKNPLDTSTVQIYKECSDLQSFRKPFIIILKPSSWETSLKLCFCIVTFSRMKWEKPPRKQWPPDPCGNASLQASWLHTSRCTQLFLSCSSAVQELEPWREKSSRTGRAEPLLPRGPVLDSTVSHDGQLLPRYIRTSALWDNVGGWCSGFWMYIHNIPSAVCN